MTGLAGHGILEVRRCWCEADVWQVAFESARLETSVVNVVRRHSSCPGVLLDLQCRPGDVQ